jgi:hypothetical protein
VPIAPRMLAALVLSACAGLAITVSPVATDVAAAKKVPTKKLRHKGTVSGQPDSVVAFTVVKKGRKLVRAENVRIDVTLLCDDGNDNLSRKRYTRTFGNAPIKRVLGLTAFGWSADRITLPEAQGGYEGFLGKLTHRGKRAHGDVETRYWTNDIDFCTIEGAEASSYWHVSWRSRAH